jgi:putative spermidine/putrescine transport system substrate-binding protein
MHKLQRRFVAGGVLIVSLAMATAACGSSAAQAATIHSSTKRVHGTLAVFSQGDVNVGALWNRVLIPKFEKAYPGDKIDLVFSTDSSENTIVYDRIATSIRARKAAPFDLTDGSVPAELATAHLATVVGLKQVPNLSRVDPSDLLPVNHEAVPLRGSSVILAYNSRLVPKPPATLGALLKWVKSHPGKFDYCNPSDGGSGEGFVQGVVESYLSSTENNMFALGYAPGREGLWNRGFAELRSLTPDVFNREYPSSNQAILTMLASGSIDIGTVWSDESTAAHKDGQLPSYIKLASIHPDLFPGGPDYLAIPKNVSAAERTLALTFMNWALQPAVQQAIIGQMDGTPGIEIKYMPPAVRREYASYSGNPVLPYSAKSESDLDRLWASKVA